MAVFVAGVHWLRWSLLDNGKSSLNSRIFTVTFTREFSGLGSAELCCRI